MNRLPLRLEREPLLDAVFEVRLDDAVSLADILPGVLFGKIDPKPSIRRLPAAEIPQPLRMRDPSLMFTPTQRLECNDCTISIGDRSIIIGSPRPYPKWPVFKQTILRVVAEIAKANVVGAVERYSIKYVNLIEAPSLEAQISKVDLNLRIGNLQVTADHIELKVHHIEDETTHIMTVITGADAHVPDGRDLHGVIVDVDSIRGVASERFMQFADHLESELETLRQANKARFFACLTQETIQEMGAVYE